MSRTRSSESGFTLAGLIVMMTIIAIMIAYTIPKQWSIAMARERDQQTVFVMKQYARAIVAYAQKNGAQPTSLQQLKDARTPRLIRGKGEYVDPLTGQIDWIPVPMSNQIAQQQQQGTLGTNPIPQNPRSPSVPVTPVNPGPQATTSAAGQPGGFMGPIAGVRPNKTGTSYLVLNGMDSYDQWSYTIVDLQAEIAQHRNSIMVK